MLPRSPFVILGCRVVVSEGLVVVSAGPVVVFGGPVVASLGSVVTPGVFVVVGTAVEVRVVRNR